MTKPDACRFCRLYAVFVVGFAFLLGLILAAQLGFGVRQPGDFEHVVPIVALGAVRSLAPGVTGSALLTAFVVWAHGLPVPRLNVELPRLLKRALLVTLPGYLAALLIIAGVGLACCHVFLGLSWGAWRVKALGLTDLGGGALSALLDAGLIVFLAWRYLARLQAGQASLPIKLMLAWTFGTGLRMTAGLVLSLLLPG